MKKEEDDQEQIKDCSILAHRK